MGAVDLHFHGAFGIDLMTETSESTLDALTLKLGASGIAAFCPTTLSAPPAELLKTVSRLGPWVRSRLDSGIPSFERKPFALPLGLHLEGPFLSPLAAGAHPPGAIRPVDFRELECLWKASSETLKILTVAPETLSRSRLERLVAWCRQREVVLSLGHSRATEAQARQAFAAGFTQVTHAWNALAFHHRSPGALGAALGHPEVFLELIPDGVHLDPTVIRWTRTLHPKNRILWVSDCVPAAHLPSRRFTRFGPLSIHCDRGACRLKDGSLAGGGKLLIESYLLWLKQETQVSQRPLLELLHETLPGLTTTPLQALGWDPADRRLLRVRWQVQRNLPRFQVDSSLSAS